MKTKKMSLANIQGKLSRNEMKNIMAGSGTKCDFGHLSCSTSQECAQVGKGFCNDGGCCSL